MIFTQQDIQTDDEGEIIVDRGDMKLADAQRTAIQSVNFIVLTDFGDYTPQPTMAANLVEFIGYPNSARTHNLMLQNLYEAFRLQGLLVSRSLRISVSPVGPDEAGVLVKIVADFRRDAADDSNDNTILGFTFPYPTGQIKKLEVDPFS